MINDNIKIKNFNVSWFSNFRAHTHTQICCFPDGLYTTFLKKNRIHLPPISVSIYVYAFVQLSMTLLLGVVAWGSKRNRRYQFQLMKMCRIQIHRFIVNLKWPRNFKRFVLCRYASHTCSLFVLEQYPLWKWVQD